MDQDVKNQMVVWKEEVKKDHQEQGFIERRIVMLVPESDLDCPECESGKLRRTYSQKMRRFYYKCNQENCEGYIGAHPDGSPLGIPANKKIRQKRQEAHEVFDRLWKEGHCKRTTAYRIMAERMGIEDELHIANLGWAECEQLIKLSNEFLVAGRAFSGSPVDDEDEDEDEDGWVIVKKEER